MNRRAALACISGFLALGATREKTPPPEAEWHDDQLEPFGKVAARESAKYGASYRWSFAGYRKNGLPAWWDPMGKRWWGPPVESAPLQVISLGGVS